MIATTVSQTRIDLAWTDQSDNETGFQIERSADGVVWAQIALVSTNGMSYSDAGLACGTTFYYRVHADNAGGNSGYSNIANATTVVCAPNTPGNLTATAVSQMRIDLTWIDNSNNEEGFQLERSLDGATAWTLVATVGANYTTHSDIDLTCDQAFYYRVRAYNAGGNSIYSQTARATTEACASAPRNLLYLPIVAKGQ